MKTTISIAAAITALICTYPAILSAQQEPVSDITTEGLIEALTPQEGPLLRGISPRLREEDMPRIDLSVTFEFGSFQLTEEAEALLSNLARAMLSPNLSKYRFRLSGHTDAVGSEPFNQELSMARAEAVREFLITKQIIDPSRLESTGFGETQLLFETAPEDARNRRVEVAVLPE